MEEFEEWFKTKKYPHIGKPITIKDYNRVNLYVNNPDKIKKHSFLPFIHKTLTKRRYRANKDKIILNPSGKRQRIKSKPKERHIYFASHIDSLIFSKYNCILIEAYEKYIKEKPFNESIVAYRKIPVNKCEKGNKCNIDFAKMAFEFIKNNQNKKLTAIVADINSFFDNLNHKILKKKWAEVLNTTVLPSDHYNLFKALTRIKYVNSTQLFKAYNQIVRVERGVPYSVTKKKVKKKKINNIKYFKEKNVISYCSKSEFIKNNLNLIISKNNKTGIPQGSPISATLANIYMLDFDKIVHKRIEEIKGFYQRYSDDLIIVCEQIYEDRIIKFIRDTIECDFTQLSIEPNKTKVYRFELINGSLKGFLIDEKTKKQNCNKPLEYLGFTFDGKRVLIKNAGFSKFYRSMKSAFNRAVFFAKHGKNPDKSIFKPNLYKRFTHKGAKRKLIFRPIKNNPKIYKPTKKYYWGNYISYIHKANETMKSINENDWIKKQSRKVWGKFHKIMKTHEVDLKKYLEINTKR